MSFRVSFSAFLLTLLVSTTGFAAEFKEGELIVKYKDGTFRTRTMMNVLYDAAGVKKVRRYDGLMKGYEQVILQDNVKVQDAMAELMRNDAVEYVQPNYILHTFPAAQQQVENEVPTCFASGIPFLSTCDEGITSLAGLVGQGQTRPPVNPPPADVNPPVADPQLSKLYGMTKIAAVEAWKTYRGSKSFIVADIDTGADYNHEDLSFNMWRNPHPTQNDVVGYDFVHNDGLPYDDNKHGTHTAGTIGAVGGNGKAISGVSQRVSLMALKFLSGQGSGTTADAIRAIDYAVEHGARVLSNSWGGKGDDGNKALYDAIERAKVKNVLFIAAAGNDGTDNDGADPSYPAAFDNDNMLAVAATDERDGMAFFSNYGKKSVHLGAPGTNVYSTVPGNKYASLSGTSMACPHVAGAAALIWSAKPDMNYKQVKMVLMQTVDKLPALTNKTVTGGRLNVLKALAFVKRQIRR